MPCNCCLKSGLLLFLVFFTVVEVSLGGSSPYTSADKKKIRMSMHKRNNTKTQQIQVHISPKALTQLDWNNQREVLAKFHQIPGLVF
jgi:hypothetical protein